MNAARAARGWLLPAGWLLAFALAAYAVLRPPPLPPAPPGWQRWTQTGALYALLPSSSAVWAAGSRGLWHADAHSVNHVQVAELPANTVMYALARDQAGRLWIGHSRGISVGKAGAWLHVGSADGLPEGAVLAIVLDDAGGWLGGNGGLVRFRGEPPWRPETLKRTAPGDCPPQAPLTALLYDSGGALWVGTGAPPGDGVYRLAHGNCRHWGVAEGLPHSRVTSFLEDRRGRVWAGTGFFDRGGAVRFAPAGGAWRIEAIIGPNRLAGPKVRSLAEDGDGRIWAGSENDGLAVLAADRAVARIGVAKGLPGAEVTAIAPAPDGAVWLATLNGLARVDRAAVSRIVGKGGER